MPSPFTSSFASAAAGSSSADSSSNNRNSGSGDWSRARVNGNTTTFRRASGANTLSQRPEGPAHATSQSVTGSVYVPPHASASNISNFPRNGNVGDTRYSKDQLLDLFKLQSDKASQPNIEDLFVDGWDPRSTNGTSSGGWNRSEDRKDSHGPDVCWDYEGAVQPIGLIPLTEDEKELFSNTVNSPIKPPPQTKESTPNTPGLNRRTSLSQTQKDASASSRPSGRQRRDSSDLLNNSLTSPSTGRFFKDESNVTSPPPSLMRRKTDFKDTFGPKIENKDKDENKSSMDPTSPMGSLKRTNTNPLSAALNGPASPWSAGPTSAGFAPMGAFGSFGAPQSATEKKQHFGRSESRFKSLMSGGSSEDMKSKDLSAARQASETFDGSTRSPWESKTSAQRKELNDLYEEDIQRPAGSAALGGDDASPPAHQTSRSRNREPQQTDEDIGFASMGIGSDFSFQDFSQRNRDFSHPQPGQRMPQQSHPEPLSPTFTNPYQSPEGEKAVPNQIDTEDSEAQKMPFQQNGPFGRGLPNPLEQADRSQTSSTGAPRAFPSLSNLTGLGGNGPWSAAPGAVGTPSRAFAESAYGGYGDITSPASAGFGAGFFGSSGPGASSISASANRSSKLGPLFPTALQDQSRIDSQRQEQGLRDSDIPALATRSRLDELLSSNSDERLRSQTTSSYANKDASLAPPSTSLQAPFTSASGSQSFFNNAQEQDQSANQLPASQQRTMVMPDRMRWIYRDPQGNQQGPWSGLEMHDWYKAGFFSPELQVKKLEDTDYEPLAQLIRRIGNSREPFLVPQIGIAHGNPSAVPPNTQAPAQPTGSGSAQPPFASSFPSFGTTLTAEQQNALERRKQEEQYLMARQKEHLAAMQPVLQRQMQQQMQGNLHGQQLHHHSSAHSLHSQPSYGSITSPVGYQPSPGTGPIQPPAAGPNYFDSMSRNAAPSNESLGPMREEDLPGFMERMNLTRGGQMPFGSNTQSQEQLQQQKVNAMLNEKARLQREQQQFDASQRSGGTEETRVSAERLEEFQRLRQAEIEQQQQIFSGSNEPLQQYRNEPRMNDGRPHEQLSLSEQVQKAAAKQSPAVQPPSPWTKIDTGNTQPQPPAQPSSPMPAPTPQRNRQSVAEALNAESQSQTPSQTDSADTPNAAMAPWAKESNEVSKGPSLKEIQAMEAKKAAQQDELAAAARRALAEQERLAQHSQSIPPAPGLPSSANWASSVSPAVPTTSPWTKPSAGKAPVATATTAAAKKTLAQIQKEEEARKNRAAAAAAASAVTVTTASAGPGGKRYADLASKPSAPATQPTNNAAWTTVGAGGKVKTPAVPNPTTASRSVSGGVGAAAAKPKTTASASAKAGGNQHTAYEEFSKWIRNALGKGLNSNIAVDDFVSTLLSLPLEADMISDAIYASSQTLDGRRFAEEFVKRRKLADRGVVSDPSTGSFSNAGLSAGDGKGGANGGWSEVAKKGSQGGASGGSGQAERERESGREFRVVAGKKKGKK